jgi:hypothetical protein
LNGFLHEARRALTPFNVFLGATFFGYVCWNVNDAKIGQTTRRVRTISYGWCAELSVKVRRTLHDAMKVAFSQTLGWHTIDNAATRS